MLRHGRIRTFRAVCRAGLVIAGVAASLLASRAPADASIISLSSNLPITITTPAPGTTVTSNFLIANALVPGIAFDEQQGVLLANSLVTDTATIAAGTRVDSQFVAFNAVRQRTEATVITLDGTVLGLSVTSIGLGSSDFLGLSSLVYNDSCTACGLEPSDNVVVIGNQVFLNSTFGRPGDFLRIISEATPIPEPDMLAVMIAGAFLAFATARFRRS